MAFERDGNWLGTSFIQTLEPRLYYLYVPFRDQSRLPNFTTAEMDFTFTQLFNEMVQRGIMAGAAIGSSLRAWTNCTVRTQQTASKANKPIIILKYE